MQIRKQRKGGRLVEDSQAIEAPGRLGSVRCVED